ncbi:hypothetical protein HKX48_000022 [Thoreauomyces humboldtii]|nr:hypothetical protein HKX48_000022 [Thoreauomyces humboldtii]
MVRRRPTGPRPKPVAATSGAPQAAPAPVHKPTTSPLEADQSIQEHTQSLSQQQRSSRPSVVKPSKSDQLPPSAEPHPAAPSAVSSISPYIRPLLVHLAYHADWAGDASELGHLALVDAKENVPAAWVVYPALVASGVVAEETKGDAMMYLAKAASSDEPKPPATRSSETQAVPILKTPQTSGQRIAAAANSMLGDWYRRGVMCPANFSMSFRHLQRGAEMGDTGALGALAQMYELGAGTPRDDVLAFAYYSRSAGSMCLKSLFKAGLCLEKGKGTPMNVAKARIFYRTAAARGHFASAVRLATLMIDPGCETYENLTTAATSVGTPRAMHDCALAHSSTKQGAVPDFIQMRRWLLKAALKGHARSQWLLGKVHQDPRLKDGPLPDDLVQLDTASTTPNIATPEQRAFYWFHRAALQGYQPAQLAVCEAYRTGGPGVEKNAHLAEIWHQAATRCGCQKIRSELKDFACVTSHSLTEANGPTWNTVHTSENIVEFYKQNKPELPDFRQPLEHHSSLSHHFVDLDAEGFKDMPHLLSILERLPSPPCTQSRPATLAQLDQYRETHPTATAQLTTVKLTFLRAERLAIGQQNLAAVEAYAAAFRSFSGLFDLEDRRAVLLASIAATYVLATDSKNANALLVDCFLNMLHRPIELGIVACTRVISVDPKDPAAYVLRAAYKVRLMRFEEALGDYRIAVRLEQEKIKAAAATPPLDESASGGGRMSKEDASYAFSPVGDDRLHPKKQQSTQPPSDQKIRIVPTLTLAETFYQIGVCHSNMDGKEHRVASIKNMMYYLQMVGVTAKRVPDAHYTIAGNCLALDNVRKLVLHFSKGLEAETIRPHFLPPIVNQDLKTRLTLEVKYAIVTQRTHVRTTPWAQLPARILQMVEGDVPVPIKGPVTSGPVDSRIRPTNTASAAAAPSATIVVPGNVVAPGSVARECLACGSAAKTRACAGCRTARYCSTNCQIAHWIRGHKEDCATSPTAVAVAISKTIPA